MNNIVFLLGVFVFSLSSFADIMVRNITRVSDKYVINNGSYADPEEDKADNVAAHFFEVNNTAAGAEYFTAYNNDSSADPEVDNTTAASGYFTANNMAIAAAVAAVITTAVYFAWMHSAGLSPAARQSPPVTPNSNVEANLLSSPSKNTRSHDSANSSPFKNTRSQI